MIDKHAIGLRWDAVGSMLDERGRRLFAAAEVQGAGYGGLAAVSEITGLARSTINRGEDDLGSKPLPRSQVRRAGGGGRALSEFDPKLVDERRRLVEPATLGDPIRPLVWVWKSIGQARRDVDRTYPSKDAMIRGTLAAKATNLYFCSMKMG